jgi:gentisate 1,2-dioxygenase
MGDEDVFLRDPYSDWLERQDLPVVTDLGVDLLAIDTAPWGRLGADAAFVHLAAGGDFMSLCVQELRAGRSTAPQRHLYEEIVYVLDGHGSTSIAGDDGSTHVFEWGPKSLFALPLNAGYRHFNGSGSRSARLVSSMNLKLVMNLFHDEDFIFDNPYGFADRFGASDHFEGTGDLVAAPHDRVMWKTNFVPDLGSFGELRSWEARGARSSNIMFVMAEGVLHAHVSEMPVGTYKKGHRHGPDFSVFAVNGRGYSLLWYEGDADLRRVDWRHGVVFSPADQMFHQHFNTSPEPARYLATAMGSARYPFTEQQRSAFLRTETDLKAGGIQIEYPDQDPRIHRLYVSELERSHVALDMDGIEVAW